MNPCTESDNSLGGLARIAEVQLSTESEKPELTKLTISDITKTESKRYDTRRQQSFQLQESVRKQPDGEGFPQTQRNEEDRFTNSAEPTEAKGRSSVVPVSHLSGINASTFGS